MICAVSVIAASLSCYGQQEQITMIFEGHGEVKFSIGGSEMVTINWGDGSKIETYKQANVINEYGEPLPYQYKHEYSTASATTVTITGKNIMYLNCEGTRLTGLDVSKSIALTTLECNLNQLTSLDVSNNPALEVLHCSGNKLTNLDVSKNTALTELCCVKNQLSGLDVNKNTALKELKCGMNQFSSAALKTLFETLHSNDINRDKHVSVSTNPGMSEDYLSYEEDKKIAKGKGWLVF